MTKKQNMIPLKDLNLANRFLFDEVMEDPETHRDVLSIILGKEISILKVNQTEKKGAYPQLFVPSGWMCFPWTKKRLSIIQKCKKREKWT